MLSAVRLRTWSLHCGRPLTYRCTSETCASAREPDSSDSFVAPTAFVDSNSKIGARCKIGPFVYISEGVTLGDDCVISANASLSNCDLGDRVVVGPGVRIGQVSVSSEFALLFTPDFGSQ